MMRKTLSMIVLGLALATVATSAVRADGCPECALSYNGPAANTLTMGQTGQIVAVELR